jgi:hypothetical protein
VGGGEVVLKRGERNPEWKNSLLALCVCVCVRVRAGGRAQRGWRLVGVVKKGGARRTHVLPLSCSSFSNLNKISNFGDLSIINSIQFIIIGTVRVQVVSSESRP